MEKYVATVNVTKEEWEAIQASFSVDLREDVEGYNEEIIDKYDFRAGTNPETFTFHFEDGLEVVVDWYVEEFGGAIRWYSSLEEDYIPADDYELHEEETFISNNGDHYTCKFIII